jgi:NADH-quinone oxidoreductase subunit L
MVNAGVYLLARFFPAFENVSGWTTAVMCVGVVTAVLAALMALVSQDIKRVLAYSTVSQLGFMVYAVGTGAIFASQFHLFSHSIFKALLFLAAGALIHAVGTRDLREMGGLGKKYPFIRNVFIIGSLALAGIPILNGFWSKELILEAGLTHSATWMYVSMLVCTGLTALYTLRLVWLVFYGESRKELHGHGVGAAMKTALIPLALGACLSWLIAGPFSELLTINPIPKIIVFSEPTWNILKEVISVPTLLALGVIALGVILWLIRDKIKGLTKLFGWLGWSAEQSFGFEWINTIIVKGTQASAEGLRVTQTGLLSWNIFSILGALVVLLAILIFGA